MLRRCGKCYFVKLIGTANNVSKKFGERGERGEEGRGGGIVMGKASGIPLWGGVHGGHVARRRKVFLHAR